MAIKRHYEQIHPLSREEWRSWLERNHATSPGIWFVSYRGDTDKPRLSYDETVEEALCFGWIDSIKRVVDPERSILLVTPRKPGSQWSAVNKRRIERLEAAGLIAPAGRARIDAAKADGSWTLLDDVENLVVPDDLAEAFARHPGSAEQWEAFPRSARRAILEWIVQAKRPETRAKRLEETAGKAARGERANEWRPKG